jgi:hypothetical protein
LGEASVTFAPPNSSSPEKGADSSIRALALVQVIANGAEILNGPFNAAGHDHGARLTERCSPFSI